MTWNLAHGRGALPFPLPVPRFRSLSILKKAAQFIQKAKPHLVGFQEIDLDGFWSGRIDQLDYLSRHTGLPFYRYSLHCEKIYPPLSYGNGILTSLPILYFYSHPFGRKGFGQKGFLYTELLFKKQHLSFVVLHLDYRSSRKRIREIQQLIQFLKKKKKLPLILGDWNCDESSQDALTYFLSHFPKYRRLPKSPTFPSFWPYRLIDHILLPPSWNALQVRVIPTNLSDHLPVVVDLTPAGTKSQGIPSNPPKEQACSTSRQ